MVQLFCSLHFVLEELVTDRCWFFICSGSTNNRILLHSVIVLIGSQETSITSSSWPEETHWGCDWHLLCLPTKVLAAEAGALSLTFPSYWCRSHLRDVIERCDRAMWLVIPIWLLCSQTHHHIKLVLVFQTWTQWSVPDEMWSLIGIARSSCYHIWYWILLPCICLVTA